MKVRISYTVNVSDRMRRAIRAYYGQPGLASRRAIQDWYWLNGHSMDDTAEDELAKEEKGESDGEAS